MAFSRTSSVDVVPYGRFASQLSNVRHHPASIIPVHVAECLSRALEVIPLYGPTDTASKVDAAQAASVYKCVAFALDARASLGRSMRAANEIRTALSLSLRSFGSLKGGILKDELQMARRKLDHITSIAQSTRDAIGHVYDAAVMTSSDLGAQVANPPSSTVPSWMKAVRVGSVCVSAPTLAAAVLSAVWNAAHPRLAFAMALVSATTGTCGAVAPCIAQWYWESSPASLSGQAPSGDVRAVQVEAHRLCYPLSLIFKWWQKLAYRMQLLTKWTDGPAEVMHDLQTLVEQVDQYMGEMRVILQSIESVCEVRKSGDVADIV